MRSETNSTFEIYSLTLTVLLFLIRFALPVFKIPFILAYAIFSIYILITYRNDLWLRIKEFFRNFLLVIILATIYLIAFFASVKLYNVILRDIIDLFIIISIFLYLSFFVDSSKKLDRFYSSFIGLFMLFSFFVSFIGMAELFDALPNTRIYTQYIESERLRQSGIYDYNFALVPVFIGLLGSFYFVRFTRSAIKVILINLLFLFFSTYILFAGSRRGIILFLIISISYFIFKIVAFLKEKSAINRMTAGRNSILLSYLLLILLWFCILPNTSASFKNNTLEFFGARDLRAVRDRITNYFLRYASIVDKNIDYKTLFEKIWTPNFDPLDPDSGWAYRIHKDVYPLTGKNAGIVPAGAIGYRMDRFCDPDTTIKSDAYIWTNFNPVYRNSTLTKISEVYEASVYCYVSDDFNGSYARVLAGQKENRYDLNSKGTWQVLKVDFESKNDIPVYLDWAKLGSSDLQRDLTGYVIFAYPQLQIKKDSTDQQKAHDSNLGRKNQMGVFNLMQFLELTEVFSLKPEHPTFIKKVLNGLTSEDTTYLKLSAYIKVDSLKRNFGSIRTAHFEYGFQIYKKEYNLARKIFGGGFNFLNWYGNYFQNDKKSSDWPHNPFLSILLYSGIIGLILYSYLLFVAFRLYIRYFRRYPLFTFSFLIAFFFTFFSGVSPFDPPIWGFFIILPFFLDSVLRKESGLSQ